MKFCCIKSVLIKLTDVTLPFHMKKIHTFSFKLRLMNNILFWDNSYTIYTSLATKCVNMYHIYIHLYMYVHMRTHTCVHLHFLWFMLVFPVYFQNIHSLLTSLLYISTTLLRSCEAFGSSVWWPLRLCKFRTV